jgi:hypothetical protein
MAGDYNALYLRLSFAKPPHKLTVISTTKDVYAIVSPGDGTECARLGQITTQTLRLTKNVRTVWHRTDSFLRKETLFPRPLFCSHRPTQLAEEMYYGKAVAYQNPGQAAPFHREKLVRPKIISRRLFSILEVKTC